MANYGSNPYGDELKKTDEHGNPVHHQTGGECGGAHGAQPHHTAIGVPPTTEPPHHRRSGSSSSSSSEDDGQGGRRKKDKIKDKVKEKLPGGHKDNQPQHGTGYGGVAGHPEPEKKGMMDKIKEKLPGGHN